MPEINILCWNVNGIRAAGRKGFLEWLHTESPDIICIQETKAHPEQLDESLLQPHGYHAYWNYPENKGYSGVATFTKTQPVSVQNGFGIEKYDIEGRVIITEYPEFVLFNIYFPNGKKDAARLRYKMDFYEDFLEYVEPLKAQGKKLVVCGDYNTAHKEIDLSRPRENEKVSGFLPMEREWIDRFIAHGFVDTFRHFNKEPHQYTWWDLKTRARERNIGWRIDYFFVTENLLPSVSKAFIMPEVMGSDHCPIGILLRLY
jgi:exodeoxyribonuclease-3